MSMHGTPGAVVSQSATTTIKQAQKRTGLLRMGVGTLHAIPLDGGTHHVVARDWREHVGAKTVYLCLHPNCEGKTWATHEEMRTAHPESREMAKRQEAHVYGLWSADVLAPDELAKAKAAHAKAAKELADVKKMPEALTLAGREVIKEYAKVEEEAAALVAPLQACIGLISPPEPRWEEG